MISTVYIFVACRRRSSSSSGIGHGVVVHDTMAQGQVSRTSSSSSPSMSLSLVDNYVAVLVVVVVKSKSQRSRRIVVFVVVVCDLGVSSVVSAHYVHNQNHRLCLRRRRRSSSSSLARSAGKRTPLHVARFAKEKRIRIGKDCGGREEEGCEGVEEVEDLEEGARFEIRTQPKGGLGQVTYKVP